MENEAVLLSGPAEAVPEGVGRLPVRSKEEAPFRAAAREHASTLLEDRRVRKTDVSAAVSHALLEEIAPGPVRLTSKSVDDQVLWRCVVVVIRFD